MTALYADTVAALTAPAPPGTVIMLKRGQVYPGPITIRSSGAPGAPIHITAYGSGPAPIIKGLPALYTDALTLTGSYVEVDSLAITDTNKAGIEIAASASHIQVTGNEMTRVGEGVNVLGNDVQVDHNNIHDLTMVKNTPKSVNANDDYGANGVVIAGSRVEVAFNTIKNAKAPSFDYGTDGGAFEIFATGALVNVSIHDNMTEGCEGFLEGGGAAGSKPSITGLSVYRNVSLNNDGFVSLHNGGGAFGVAWSAAEFFNNTVIEEAPDLKLVLNRADGPVQNISFHHNIFSMNGGDSIWKQTGADYHHDNVFWLGTPKTTHLFNNWGMGLSPGEVRGQSDVRQ